MKKIIILLGFVLSVGFMQAQTTHETTTDKVSIATELLTLGGEAKVISFSLDKASSYSAFGLDIYLPEGIEFVEYKNSDDEYVLAEKGSALKSSHTLSYNKQKDGALRVTTLSLSSSTFKDTSTELFSVCLKASSYAKPGYASIEIKNCFFVSSSGIQYDASDQVISDKVSTGASAYANLRVSSAAHWGTCILPFETSLPGDVKAYSCNSTDDDNSNLILTRVAKMEAYTPYILYSENGYDGSVTGTVDVTKYPEEDGFIRDGYLCGAITKQVICGENYYVLQSLNSVVQFYKANNGNYTINPGKCWIDLSSANSQRVNGYGFMVDELTEIKPIQNQGHSEVYGLDGRRVNNMASGHLYIENGRKIFKK